MRGGRFLLTVGAAYAACRLFSFVLLVVVSRYQDPVSWTGPDPDYLGMTVLWDGSWYRHIAENGYPVPLPQDAASGALQQNAWAFYPLFPLTARAVMTVTGLGFPLVGSTLALLAGLGAALLMGVLLRDRLGPGVAVAAVVVWGCFPASPSLQVAYSESFAMLLLCLFLLLLARGRLGWAGGVAVLIGVTRPIAVPLGVVALVAVWQRWRRRREEPVTGAVVAGWLAVLAGCGVGAFLWPAIAWWATGVPSAYTDTMATWRGSGQVTWFRPWWDMAHYLFGDRGPFWLAVIVVGLLALVLGPWASALGAQLRTWCLAYPAYLFAVLDPFTSIFRYLIPLFPLAAVAVGGGGGKPRSTTYLVVRTTVVVLVFLPLQVWWTYALFRFVPPSDYPP